MRQRGLTVVEVLVALVIGAILMGAIATAVGSAAKSVATNRDYATSLQAIRLSMARVLTIARQADTVDVGAGLTAAGTKTGQILYVTTPQVATDGNETLVKTSYVFSNNMLLLDTKPWTALSDSPPTDLQSRMTGSSPTVFVLARNVSSLTFSAVYANTQSIILATRLQIDMTSSNGGQVVRVTDSTSIRRNADVR